MPKGSVEITFPQKGNKKIIAKQGEPLGKVVQRAGLKVKFDCKVRALCRPRDRATPPRLTAVISRLLCRTAGVRPARCASTAELRPRSARARRYARAPAPTTRPCTPFFRRSPLMREWPSLSALCAGSGRSSAQALHHSRQPINHQYVAQSGCPRVGARATRVVRPPRPAGAPSERSHG